MRIRFVAVASLLLSLTACSGGSSLNPMNLFRNDGPKPVAVIPEGGFTQDQDGRQMVAQLTDVKLLRNPDGVILRAKGLPPRLGYWDAELVSPNDFKPENGVLTFEFRISEPAFHTEQGQPTQREIYVGRFISNVKLRDVRSIRVVSATNSISARR